MMSNLDITHGLALNETKYRYFRESSSSINNDTPMITPRRRSDNFNFDNIPTPENLEQLMLADYYTKIPKALCSGFQFIRHVKVNVSFIPDKCFENCESLVFFKAGERLMKIGNCAFKGCQELCEVYIPNVLTSIGISAFEDCVKLTKHIPSTTISPLAFKHTGITRLNITDTKSIGASAFEECIRLVDVALSCECMMEPGVFKGCTNLTAYRSNTPSIPKFTFMGTGFESIIFSKHVKDVDTHALSDIPKLKCIIIDNPSICINSSQDMPKNVLIRLNTKKLGDVVKFMVCNEGFVVSADVVIARQGSDVMKDLTEMLRQLEIDVRVNIKTDDSSDANDDSHTYAQYYALIVAKFHVQAIEQEIRELVNQIDLKHISTTAYQIKIIIRNINAKLTQLSNYRTLYEMFLLRLK